jgi:hypothetical protein
METNIKLAKLDTTGMQKDGRPINKQYLRSVLVAYINNHRLPVKIFSAGGEMYMMRLDLDNEGQKIAWEWQDKATEGSAGNLRDQTPQPITPEVVQQRSAQERKQPTK